MNNFIKEINGLTDWPQKTESKIMFPELAAVRPIKEFIGIQQTKPSNEIFGDMFYYQYIPVKQKSNIVYNALSGIDSTKPKSMINTAINILFNIQSIVDVYREVELCLEHIPPIRSFNLEDGSISLEWVFNDFRIGFSIEENGDDSSWYIITNSNLGNVSASGYLSKIDINTIILWLINFIVLTMREYDTLS
jgi:hypothetical protein